MKVKTILHGSDGVREYGAGEVLEGDSTHVRVLLMNALAEPLDEQAKRICDERDEMTEDEWESHPLASHAHWDRGDEARAASAEAAAQNESEDTADVHVGVKSSAPEPLKE